MLVGKTVAGTIRIFVPAGKAGPSRSLGPALGQKGIKIMDFCKEFNARSKDLEPGIPIPVKIFSYTDKTFSFIMKTPPITYLVKKMLGNVATKGSKTPGRGEAAGTLTPDQVTKIAQIKMADLNVGGDLEAAYKTICGSLRSMDVRVEE